MAGAPGPSAPRRLVAARGLSLIRAELLKTHNIPEGEGYPLSKELLLLWTMRAAHQPLFKDRGIRVNAVSPGPVVTPIFKEFRQLFGDARVDDDVARLGLRARRRILHLRCCFCAPTARAGSMA